MGRLAPWRFCAGRRVVERELGRICHAITIIPLPAALKGSPDTPLAAMIGARPRTAEEATSGRRARGARSAHHRRRTGHRPRDRGGASRPRGRRGDRGQWYRDRRSRRRSERGRGGGHGARSARLSLRRKHREPVGRAGRGRARDKALRRARHPRQQCGDPARRLHLQGRGGRLGRRHPQQPLGRLLSHGGGNPAHARGKQGGPRRGQVGAHRQHRLECRPLRQLRPGELRQCQGRARGPLPHRRPRSRHATPSRATPSPPSPPRA